MTGRGFSLAEQHLLSHAAEMGGWLSVSYSRGDYEQAMNGLLRDGLFRREERGTWHVHQLTAAGSRAAAELGVAS